ncbi:helicase-related protein [Thiocapsa marina]|uniref:Helicase domain-containing protein n=1 Tax=Thiocapsa marina 5811 TaxID=768671 RepID=F9UGK1_9GAMM|nr:helicase-related protein [Thiocapsa marina]EGV16684.1 helicase domain-containing protein [Thiocapsa marina 5811]
MIESPVYRREVGLWEHQKHFVKIAFDMHLGPHGARFVLADQVGLGKTIQLAMAAQLMARAGDKPVLILALKPLIWQWQGELNTLLDMPSAVWDGRGWVDENGIEYPSAGPESIRKCPRRVGSTEEGWRELGCIIFSQYFDSVLWLATRLTAEIPEEEIGIYAGARRSGIMHNGVFTGAARELIKERVRTGKIRVLIGTDVASEGLNLQRLGTLINLDLPWNPSRLEQRKGRCFRSGWRTSPTFSDRSRTSWRTSGSTLHSARSTGRNGRSTRFPNSIRSSCGITGSRRWIGRVALGCWIRMSANAF